MIPIIEKKKLFLQIGFLIASALLLFIGIHRGEAAIVWNKAVNICMECIGLG